MALNKRIDDAEAVYQKFVELRIAFDEVFYEVLSTTKHKFVLNFLHKVSESDSPDIPQQVDELMSRYNRESPLGYLRQHVRRIADKFDALPKDNGMDSWRQPIVSFQAAQDPHQPSMSLPPTPPSNNYYKMGDGGGGGEL